MRYERDPVFVVGLAIGIVAGGHGVRLAVLLSVDRRSKVKSLFDRVNCTVLGQERRVAGGLRTGWRVSQVLGCN